jgi:hypothetical protein
MKNKLQKRQEADVRNKKWNSLSSIEKLQYLNDKNLRAPKQREKLGQIDNKGNIIIPKNCIY